MPAYEFICNYCGNKVEVFATVSQKEKELELWRLLRANAKS